MQRLDERMRVLGHLRRGRTAGPDRPHGLVRDDESFVPRKSRHLTSKDGLGLAGLPLGFGLPHARNHGEPCFECGFCPEQYRLVRLRKVLAPLRMTDDRTRDPELVEHGR